MNGTPAIAGTGMEQRSKLLIIGLGAVAAIGVACSVWLFTSAQQASMNFLRLEQQIREENTQLRDRLAAVEAERQGLEARLTTTGGRLEEVRHELEMVKGQYEELDAEYRSVQVERDQLAGQVQQMSTEREQLQDQMARLSGEKSALEQTEAELKRTLDRLEQENRRLTERLDDLTHRAAAGAVIGVMAGAVPTAAMQTIELPPIVVQQGGGRPVTPAPVTGKVVQVDRAHQFAVVNKGRRDGVQQGMTFQVSRNGNPIGKMTALRVRDNFTACDLGRSTAAAVAVGDQILVLP
ncbi:MAG: hypothetical protein HY597_02565 [Candidatus Omnitrophica bacterium]|nr:hypothetical protein [Candidatus Omnitrophota bacterium]